MTRPGQLTENLFGNGGFAAIGPVQPADAERDRVEHHPQPGTAGPTGFLADFTPELPREVDRVVVVFPGNREAGHWRCTGLGDWAGAERVVREDIISDGFGHLHVGETEAKRAIIEFDELWRNVAE